MKVKYHTFRPGITGVVPYSSPRSNIRITLEQGGRRRNELPAGKPYVYQGTGYDTLTAFMDDEPGETIRNPRGRPATQPCGTLAAYRRHYRHGETPCESCMQARDRYKEDRAAARRAAA